MNSETFIIMALAGISTGIGALPLLFKKQFSQHFLTLMTGFSAGVMLVASFTALLLPSLERAQVVYTPQWSLVAILLALALGYYFVTIIHHYLPHHHSGLDQSEGIAPGKIAKSKLIFMALCLHNFPEGLAVGVGLSSPIDHLGISLAIAISLQNMPEGLVVALALLAEGKSKAHSIFYAFLSGLIEPVASLMGFYFAGISEYSLPASLSFAAGTMLFIIAQEMLPELFHPTANRQYASHGVLLGISTMLALNFLFQ